MRLHPVGIGSQVLVAIALGNFAEVNRVMAEYFQAPYPARAAIGVAQLPKGAQVEMDAILVLD